MAAHRRRMVVSNRICSSVLFLLLAPFVSPALVEIKLDLAPPLLSGAKSATKVHFETILGTTAGTTTQRRPLNGQDLVFCTTSPIHTTKWAVESLVASLINGKLEFIGRLLECAVYCAYLCPRSMLNTQDK
ncbi:hypothetical protein B0H66DRAFT_564800 [Apodospora peruviana]|uniref:Uncharacterized protein n=1 Tax=Apodospora peruviana TaxID=516989 RepID=A0AAE0M1D3_9PEZI|nr:hypothetical protein B0H66DRAFT_564800 [Apodospora peruviana]